MLDQVDEKLGFEKSDLIAVSEKMGFGCLQDAKSYDFGENIDVTTLKKTEYRDCV